MRKRKTSRRFARKYGWKFGLKVGLLGAVLLPPMAPSVLAQVYTWKTDDGTIAFTDDPKGVPPRYRDQVQVRKDTSLDDYSRFTRQDPVAAKDYAKHLQRRLDALRAINGIGVAPEARREATAAASPAPDGLRVSVAAGGPTGPRIDVPGGTGAGEGPLVIQKERIKDPGSAATRHATVVRRGGKVVAILKGRTRQSNINDLGDFSDLGDPGADD